MDFKWFHGVLVGGFRNFQASKTEFIGRNDASNILVANTTGSLGWKLGEILGDLARENSLLILKFCRRLQATGRWPFCFWLGGSCSAALPVATTGTICTALAGTLRISSSRWEVCRSLTYTTQWHLQLQRTMPNNSNDFGRDVKVVGKDDKGLSEYERKIAAGLWALADGGSGKTSAACCRHTLGLKRTFLREN